jgi:hypothetical protein
MIIKSLVLLSLTTIGVSLVFPENTRNGVYQAYHNEAGEEVLKLIPESALDHRSNSQPVGIEDQDAVSESSTLSERHLVTWCGCGIHINTGDTNIATTRLQSIIDSGYQVPGYLNSHIRALVAVLVVFLCNWDNTLTPRSSYASDGPKSVTQSCGFFVPGTWRNPGPLALDYGYMNY